MFRPNTFGYWTARLGFNDYGEPLWRAPVKTPCGVLNVTPVLKPTPVRTDASASQAGSDEIDSVSHILVPATHRLKIGDKFQLDGQDFRVIAVQANRRVSSGAIDHYEITLDSWQN